MFQKPSGNVARCLQCQFSSPWLTTTIKNPYIPRSHSPILARLLGTATTLSAVPRTDAEPPDFYVRRSRPRSRTTRLSVNTLGQPGDVVILEDREGPAEDRFSRLVEKEAECDGWSNLSEILKELDREKIVLVGVGEVAANFEAIRSFHPHPEVLGRTVWANLRDMLRKGFTFRQMSDYIESYDNSTTTSPESENPTRRNPTWKAGTSLFLEMGSDTQERIVNRIAGLRGMTGKMLLAERILRDCWKLSVENEVGQLDIHLTRQNIAMLLHSKCGPLREIADLYSAKIDVFQSLRLVRITGTQTACENVQQSLSDFVSRLRLKLIDLPGSGSIFPGSDDRFDGRFLAWLQNLYPVFCEKDLVTCKLAIHYLEGNEMDAEEARRNICFGMCQRSKPPSDICTYFPDSQPANMYPIMNLENMSWVDRRYEWVRWTKTLLDFNIPDGRGARRPPAAVYNKQPSGALNRIQNFLFEEPCVRPEFLPGERSVRDTVVAAVGKCLFRKHPALSTDEVKFARLRLSSAPRTFTTDIPNTRSFLNGLGFIEDGCSKAIHRIRLVPSTSNSQNFPQIELELEMLPSTGSLEWSPSPTLRRATAIVHERSVDMLLPETSLDLRFTRVLHYDLLKRYDTLDLGCKGESTRVFSKILDCVESLQYNFPLSRTQPPVPPFCRLSIPQRLLQENILLPHNNPKLEATLDDSKTPDQAMEAEIEGEYIFPPFQSLMGSRTAIFTYKGLELNYAHYNSGPMLPTHTTNVMLILGLQHETSHQLPESTRNYLSTISNKDTQHQALQRAFGPFYRRACQMAFELGALHGDTGSSGEAE